MGDDAGSHDYINMMKVKHHDSKRSIYKYDCGHIDYKYTGLCKSMKDKHSTCDRNACDEGREHLNKGDKKDRDKGIKTWIGWGSYEKRENDDGYEYVHLKYYTIATLKITCQKEDDIYVQEYEWDVHRCEKNGIPQFDDIKQCIKTG